MFYLEIFVMLFGLLILFDISGAIRQVENSIRQLGQQKKNRKFYVSYVYTYSFRPEMELQNGLGGFSFVLNKHIDDSIDIANQAKKDLDNYLALNNPTANIKSIEIKTITLIDEYI